MEERTIGFFTQQESKINGYGAWHYLIDTPIGQFHVVEWESDAMQIERAIIDNDNDAAEKKFKRVCQQLIKKHS